MLSFATITVPGPISATSAAAVSGFMTTRISWPPRRAIQPSLLARIVNQVGSPAMFDGNRFLPLTGMPIWKMARSSTLLAVWLPEPLTVATWMLKSLTTSDMAFERNERVRGGSSWLIVRNHVRREARDRTRAAGARRRAALALARAGAPERRVPVRVHHGRGVERGLRPRAPPRQRARGDEGAAHLAAGPDRGRGAADDEAAAHRSAVHDSAAGAALARRVPDRVDGPEGAPLAARGREPARHARGAADLPAAAGRAGAARQTSEIAPGVPDERRPARAAARRPGAACELLPHAVSRLDPAPLRSPAAEPRARDRPRRRDPRPGSPGAHGPPPSALAEQASRRRGDARHLPGVPRPGRAAHDRGRRTARAMTCGGRPLRRRPGGAGWACAPLAWLVAALLVVAPPRGSADDASGLAPIPPYRGYVTDDAGMIGERRAAELESFLDQLQRKTQVQFAVLTVKSCAPE